MADTRRTAPSRRWRRRARTRPLATLGIVLALSLSIGGCGRQAAPGEGGTSEAVVDTPAIALTLTFAANDPALPPRLLDLRDGSWRDGADPSGALTGVSGRSVSEIGMETDLVTVSPADGSATWTISRPGATVERSMPTVFPTPDGTALWVYWRSALVNDPGAVELVGRTDHLAQLTLSLPSTPGGFTPAMVSPEGLVLWTQDTSMLLAPDGSIRPLGSGRVVAMTAAAVLRIDCSSAGPCALWLDDPAGTRSPRAVPAPLEGSWSTFATPGTSIVSPDGGLAALAITKYTPVGPHDIDPGARAIEYLASVVLDLRTRRATVARAIPEGAAGELSMWSEDSAFLVLYDQAQRRLHAYDVSAERRYDLPYAVPENHLLIGGS